MPITFYHQPSDLAMGLMRFGAQTGATAAANELAQKQQAAQDKRNLYSQVLDTTMKGVLQANAAGFQRERDQNYQEFKLQEAVFDAELKKDAAGIAAEQKFVTKFGMTQGQAMELAEQQGVHPSIVLQEAHAALKDGQVMQMGSIIDSMDPNSRREFKKMRDAFTSLETTPRYMAQNGLPGALNHEGLQAKQQIMQKMQTMVKQAQEMNRKPTEQERLDQITVQNSFGAPGIITYNSNGTPKGFEPFEDPNAEQIKGRSGSGSSSDDGMKGYLALRKQAVQELSGRKDKHGEPIGGYTEEDVRSLMADMSMGTSPQPVGQDMKVAVLGDPGAEFPSSAQSLIENIDEPNHPFRKIAHIYQTFDGNLGNVPASRKADLINLADSVKLEAQQIINSGQELTDDVVDMMEWLQIHKYIE